MFPPFFFVVLVNKYFIIYIWPQKSDRSCYWINRIQRRPLNNFIPRSEKLTLNHFAQTLQFRTNLQRCTYVHMLKGFLCFKGTKIFLFGMFTKQFIYSQCIYYRGIIGKNVTINLPKKFESTSLIVNVLIMFIMRSGSYQDNSVYFGDCTFIL